MRNTIIKIIIFLVRKFNIHKTEIYLSITQEIKLNKTDIITFKNEQQLDLHNIPRNIYTDSKYMDYAKKRMVDEMMNEVSKEVEILTFQENSNIITLQCKLNIVKRL